MSDFSTTTVPCPRRRILVIDDNLAIHADYRKILTTSDDARLAEGKTSIFGEDAAGPESAAFEIDSAFQGLEGVELLQRAMDEGDPYAMAFVDVCMPPGIDGIETAARLWARCPNLQIVIATAYSDRSWTDVFERIGHNDRFLILKKPFDNVEVLQLAHALTEKWRLAEQVRHRLSDLETRVQERTRELVSANEKMGEQAALLDKAQDAIMVWNLAGVVQFWNRSAGRVYGVPAAEVVDRKVDEIFQTDAAPFPEAWLAVMTDGVWTGELTHTCRDGRKITLEGRWTLVRDEQNVPSAILAINTDITVRKQLEAQSLRTQRLESIGTLAGGLAHDLNNVLSPIVMSVQLLRMSKLSAADLEVLETVESSARRGAEMVGQVLSFARGVEGERVLMQAEHCIRDIQKIATDTFPKNIRLTTAIAPGLWNIVGDSTQLYQVLLNLCVNARDALPDGGSIAISAENLALDANYVAMNPGAKIGPHISLEVKDDGAGMPPELLEKIFDPFFTTKAFGKGTGLGLSTTLAIVKSHGGFLRVQSESGKGTTFQICLPADAAEAVFPCGTARPVLPRGRGELVMLVDDEAPIRNVTKQMLEMFGYRVAVAADGAEAIAIYAKRREEIAIVVTDMMMPVMDGTATIQVLAKMNPAVKIIATSGLTTNGPRAFKLSPAVKHFIPKPYVAGTILKILAESLSAEAVPAQTAA